MLLLLAWHIIMSLCISLGKDSTGGLHEDKNEERYRQDAHGRSPSSFSFSGGGEPGLTGDGFPRTSTWMGGAAHC